MDAVVYPETLIIIHESTHNQSHKANIWIFTAAKTSNFINFFLSIFMGIVFIRRRAILVYEERH
jgi:hypothetical protein